jgi:nitronate monooxygenase
MSFVERLGIRYPVIQAPMGGGISNPALAAAVSEAGGLGSLGSGYDAPEKIAEEIREVRQRTSLPFQVNLFIPPPSQQQVAVEPMLELLGGVYQRLNLEPPKQAPPPWPFTFEQQMEALIEERVPVFSFTFGALEQRYFDALRARDTLIVGTATTLGEAEHLERSGVDAIILQGSEAGAHRGSFLPCAEPYVGLMSLIQQIRARVRVPLIASGGIMNGAGAAAAMALGADAVQMGTAFLLTHESGAAECYKQAVLSAKPEDTKITRAFSGREARGIRNEFMREVEASGVEIPLFPIQNDLTRPLRRFAAQQNRAEFLSLWSGQNGSLGRRTSAAELVRVLMEEYRAASPNSL